MTAESVQCLQVRAAACRASLCAATAWLTQPSTAAQAEVRVLQGGVERRLRVSLRSPHRLIPVHIQGRPPPYFILGGLVFTQVVPGLLTPLVSCSSAQGSHA